MSAKDLEKRVEALEKELKELKGKQEVHNHYHPMQPVYQIPYQPPPPWISGIGTVPGVTR